MKQQGGLQVFAQTVRMRETLYQGCLNTSLSVDMSTTGGEAKVFSGKHHPSGDG